MHVARSLAGGMTMTAGISGHPNSKSNVLTTNASVSRTNLEGRWVARKRKQVTDRVTEDHAAAARAARAARAADTARAARAARAAGAADTAGGNEAEDEERPPPYQRSLN